MSTALEIVETPESEQPMKQVASWEPFEEKLAKLQMTALTLKVTDISQTSEMKLARATRLTLRELRIAVEHRRKELGEYHLRETQRINAGAKTLKDLIEPLEERLLEQEEFAERKAAKERVDRNTARLTELRPFVTDPSVYNLADMAEQDYQELLAMCKTMTEQKRIAAEKAEADRLAQAKLEAEERERIRQENERLKKEAQEREQTARVEAAKAQAERQRLQQQADAERKAAAEAARRDRDAIEARARAEREAVEAKARAEREKAAEALAKERRARQKLEEEQKAKAIAEAQALEDARQKLAASRERVALFFAAYDAWAQSPNDGVGGELFDAMVTARGELEDLFPWNETETEGAVK